MRHNLIFKHKNIQKYRQCIIHSIILGMSYTAKNKKNTKYNTFRAVKKSTGKK
jgi:hypothetical protein